MSVPQAIKTRVVAELTKCIEALEKRFTGYKFPMPTIYYTQRGTTAGTAKYSNWSINLNPGLLIDPRHTTEMIELTAPHELAHLVTIKVYPETMERGPMQLTRRGLKRGKREVHGPRWQHVMRVMGKDPERCHNMDTTNVITRERKRYEWLCTGCNTVIELGPKHNAAKLRGAKVFHKTCRQAELVKPRTGAAAPTAPAPAPRPAPIMQRMLPPAPPTTSKLDLCKRQYIANRTLPRSEMIALFVRHAQCTPAGAATYYASIKKTYG